MLHTISFLAVVIVILLAGWIALMLESGAHPPRTEQGAVKPHDEPAEAAAPEREAA